MLRRASLAFFLIALGLAVACGRQVTPSPTFGSLSGTLQIKFSVADSFDFTQFNYWMVFNTTGIGGEPYAPSLRQGNFKNFSYAFIVGAITGGQNTVLPSSAVLLHPATRPDQSSTVQRFNPGTTPTSSSNTDGTDTQFTLIFPRSQLALPPPTAPTPIPRRRSKTTLEADVVADAPRQDGSPRPGPTPVSSPTVSSQSTWWPQPVHDRQQPTVQRARRARARSHRPVVQLRLLRRQPAARHRVPAAAGTGTRRRTRRRSSHHSR